MYVAQDAQGNVTALVQQSRRLPYVEERYTYTPYGGVTICNWTWSATQSNTLYQRARAYLFQGGRFDTAVGLYNFRHRDYSPSLGRWLQQDAAGYQASGRRAGS